MNLKIFLGLKDLFEIYEIFFIFRIFSRFFKTHESTGLIRFVESFGIKKCTRFFSSDLPLGVKSLANF